ncbi:MAG: NAD(P)-dependent oxidoreductase [Solirubrobacterales bacterium]|nr:NAD(P)-dependent oxidoreductase [Solirubrobacterales bacterium]
MQSGDSIGFVGLGNMGQPMSARLGAAGFRVAAFDIDARARERASGKAGVEVVSTVSAVAAGTGAVILILPNSQVVREVVLDQGLLEALEPGALLIDMSSSDASETRALSGPLTTRGVRFLDAPVSGGVAGARDGTLTIMVGGAEADLADGRAALEALGEEVIHVGGLGAGHALKALNNLLSATSLLASSEVLATAIEFGLDPEVVLDVVNRSSGRSWSTELKLPKFVLTGSFESGFGLRLMLKDMRIATGLARRMGTPALLGEAVVEYWTQAAGALAEDADHTEIARWVAQRRETNGETE